MALGRELASPQQARVQKFGLANITTARRSPRAIPNGKRRACTLPEPTARARRRRCWNPSFAPPVFAPDSILRRISSESTNASASTGKTSRTKISPRPGRACTTSIESLLASGKLAAHPTYFECITALAFAAFAESGVAFAVYEVGLGGRLDSTNIVVPEVAVITSIDFDHESFLGHSIAEIAGEKAGIIKPGVPVVSSAERPEARAVIAQRCSELGARLVEVDAAWKIEETGESGGCYRAVATEPGYADEDCARAAARRPVPDSQRAHRRHRRTASGRARIFHHGRRHRARHSRRFAGPGASRRSAIARPCI